MKEPHWTSRQATIIAPARRNDVIVNQLDGEASLVDPQAGNTYLLNHTAFGVWKKCDGTRTTRQIAKQLTERYEVDLEVALDHVEQLVVLMTKTKLINNEELQRVA